MSDESSAGLQDKLLDDFFAEFDELLTHVRNGLVQLETHATPDAPIIEALFRHLHTLKGICGIAGLREGEQLAHGLEDLLRALKKGQVPLSAEMIDALFAGAQRLGLIGNALRLKKTPPEIADLLARLASFRSASSAPPVSPVPTEVEPTSDPIPAARSRGLHLFTARFTPSAELAQRDVNVGTIRERLALGGEILAATPIVKSGGGIIFEFVVGFRAQPDDLVSWAADGVELSALPAPPTKLIAEAELAESLSLTPSHLVRVDLTQLDDLMRIAGEMVIHRSRLDDRLSKTGNEDTALKEINLSLARALREMRRVITHIRMVPIAEIFTRMPFVVRDLMRESDKQVRVALEGRQIEVDKFIVERLKEPLLHLVRNAFVHGIETPAERVQAGKPVEATIELHAHSQSESIIIQVRDDGRGIDPAKVAARARIQGLTVPESLEGPALLKILCALGFSTRDEADLAAGRGVGMAVVANTVQELGGTLTLESTVGRGSVFTLQLPLTLSITDALIVTAGAQTCAIPQSAVQEIIQIAPSEFRLVGSTGVIPYRRGLLPLKSLRTIFQLPAAESRLLTVLVLSAERGSVGLIVDRVLAQREIVIRPLADALLKVPDISGATELGDGRPILILNPQEITQGVHRPVHASDNLEQPLAEMIAP